MLDSLPTNAEEQYFDKANAMMTEEEDTMSLYREENGEAMVNGFLKSIESEKNFIQFSDEMVAHKVAEFLKANPRCATSLASELSGKYFKGKEHHAAHALALVIAQMAKL